MRAAERLVAILAIACALAACKDVIEERVKIRSNCLTCHRPLDDSGEPHGIEVAHPAYPLSCTDCHGGTPYTCDGTLAAATELGGEPTCDGTWVYDKERAHVAGPGYIKNLPSSKLDELDPAYVRFVNPGDFRVMDQTCGVCHIDQVKKVLRSTMAHTAGEVTVARYRAMQQAEPRGLVGAVAIDDPDHADASACGVASLEQFDPPPLDVTNPTVAEAQDQYMVKSCFRCHLNDFGENRFQGDLRSSGCTACHMGYADDGLYVGNDPRINKGTIPHPRTHELTKSPSIETCTHCHYRGGRLGIGYQGYRESGGTGTNPDNPGVLGIALHGHDANYYLTDEDTTNDWDETPPDVHFEAGMSCVDCHTKVDVHGDGHLYADTQCAVTTRCEDCHGSVREKASLSADRENLFERDGALWLRTKAEGKELEVVQVKDTITPGTPHYSANAAMAMGVGADGFSHTDQIECYTCHAGWLPSCYGCHVEIDLSQTKPYHTTGAEQPGKPTGSRRWVVLNDLVLLRNVDGKLAPSMPAERFFMTLLGSGSGSEEERTIFANKPRTFITDEGRKIAGFGQRAFNPHTTQRKSAFMACDRCHSVGSAAAPTNEVLLDLTHGFGTERVPHTACDVSNEDQSCGPADQMTYQLDAVLTRDGKPLVAVGHPDPMESRPLNLDEIKRMRDVVVPANAPYRTEIPADAKTNVRWPFAQKME